MPTEWSFLPEHERRAVLVEVAKAATLADVNVLMGNEPRPMRPCDQVLGRLTPSQWCGWYECMYGSPLHRTMEAHLYATALTVKEWNPRAPAKKAARAAILADIADAVVTKCSSEASRREIRAVLAGASW